MKKQIRYILPQLLMNIRQFLQWRNRGYLEQCPQFVKQKIFLKYGVPGAPWVETGTYFGTTTSFLLGYFPFVYSIEPAKVLFENATRRFKGENVELFNAVSEEILPRLLKSIRGDLNFWLDGHYSAGMTFRGETDCPVESELSAISENLEHFARVTILIDDVRSFLADAGTDSDYPSVNYLVDWAREYDFDWRIEQDIFIMQKTSQRKV